MASSANEVTFCTEFSKILSKHNCVCLLKIIETKTVTLKKQNYRNLNIENKHEQPSHSNTHAKNSCDLGEWKRTWQKKIGGYYKPWSSNSRKKIIFSLKRKVLQLQVLF